MKRSMLLIAMLGVCAAAGAQTTRPADVRTFELTPAAPPTPALKYQLLFDDIGERRPGNAALLYLDAILLMGPDTKDKALKALDAYEAKDMRTFESLADSLQLPNVFDELDLAGRRETCDWQPPYREKGAYTLLPHLQHMIHGLARVVKVRALRQIERGQADDALTTLRLGYELGKNTGPEGVLISGLVSVGITSQMNDALARLMSRPECPNLYWALAEFPSAHGILRRSMDGERQWWAAAWPSFPGANKGQDLPIMAKVGAPLSPDQWRSMFDYVWGLVSAGEGEKTPPRVDPVKEASPETLRQAREEYARVHHVAAGDAAKVDPIIILGEFYFRQYEIVFDETYKLRGLPYPELFKLADDAAARAQKRSREQRGNPFLQVILNLHKPAASFALADRQLAALTAVEAIRSYAAANAGKLPAKLQDVTETPVPENPMTARPFDYRVENGAATLSDPDPDAPLAYTIRIRG